MAEGQQQQLAKQSRVGKQPVKLPSGVQLQVQGSTVTVKGPNGEAERHIPEAVKVSVQDGVAQIEVKSPGSPEGIKYQGLTRSLVANLVQGVHEGFTLALDLHGVGYRAELKGQDLQMNLGLSHPVAVTLPEGISAKVETIDSGGTKRPRLHLSSHDKQLLGEVAARIRSYRPPEPYKGKGIRYRNERVREKAGKAGKGGK